MRSARLGYKNIQQYMSDNIESNCKYYTAKDCLNYFAIQRGDRMTGWEIIASLPLDEQQQMMYAEIPEYMKQCQNSTMINALNKVEGIIFALDTLYEWNGKEWMGVKE